VDHLPLFPDVYPNPEIGDWSDPKKLLAVLRRRQDTADQGCLTEDWERRQPRGMPRGCQILQSLRPYG